MKASEFFASFSKQIIFIILSLTVLTPIVYIVLGSFKSKPDYVNNPVGLPSKWVISNYQILFKDGEIFTWFKNSIIVTILAVMLSIVISALAAYAFSKLNFTGKEKLFNFLISLMVIPPIIMVIPLFVMATEVRLVNTYWSAILIYNGLMLPFNIYLLRNFFVTISPAMIDSAKIDGCNDLGIFFRIIIPLSKSALITLIVVQVLWVWNDLLIALIFLQKSELNTIMVGLLQFKGKFRVNQPAILAGIFASMLPMIITYIIGQRFFVQGLTAGALKGE